jgi:hypothetical protein
MCDWTFDISLGHVKRWLSDRISFDLTVLASCYVVKSCERENRALRPDPHCIAFQLDLALYSLSWAFLVRTLKAEPEKLASIAFSNDSPGNEWLNVFSIRKER